MWTQLFYQSCSTRWSDRYKYNHHSNHIFSSLIEISFLWSFRCKKRNIRGIKRPHKKVKTILIFSSSCEGSLPDSSTVLWLTQNRSFRPVVIRSLWPLSFSFLNSRPAKIRSWRVDQFYPPVGNQVWWGNSAARKQVQPWLAAEFLPAAVWFGDACALRTHHPPAPFTLTRHEGGSPSTKEAARAASKSKPKHIPYLTIFGRFYIRHHPSAILFLIHTLPYNIFGFDTIYHAILHECKSCSKCWYRKNFVSFRFWVSSHTKSHGTKPYCSTWGFLWGSEIYLSYPCYCC